jgi:hypothetical protein
LHRFGRFVRSLIGAVAILVDYALSLRNPVPQGAASKLAPAKVFPQSNSLRTSRLNHRSQ